MFSRGKLSGWDAYFHSCSERGGEIYYFCRLDSYGHSAEEFLARYMGEVKTGGIYLKGKIPNPDERQLAFLEEIVGIAFVPDGNFILQTLKKWLPRLNERQLEAVTESMYQILVEMARSGKTENMQKNAYYKFMCWFYYKFERILTQMGKDKLPKILYEGDVTDYELKVLRILADCGCDVLLVERNGDEAYRRLDPDSSYSELIPVQGGGRFPENFSLASLTLTPGAGAGRTAAGASRTTSGSPVPGGSRPAGGTPTMGGTRPTSGAPTSGGTRPASGAPTSGGSRPASEAPVTGAPRPTPGTPSAGSSQPPAGNFRLGGLRPAGQETSQGGPNPTPGTPPAGSSQPPAGNFRMGGLRPAGQDSPQGGGAPSSGTPSTATPRPPAGNFKMGGLGQPNRNTATGGMSNTSSTPPPSARPQPSAATRAAAAQFQIQTAGVMGTNIWLSGDILQDSLKRSSDRGKDPNIYYNLFAHMRGTDDKENYQKELLRWKMRVDDSGRKLFIAEGQILMPGVDEVKDIKRGNYTTLPQLLGDMLTHISYPKCRELENLVKKAFVEMMCEEDKPLQILTNQAVLLLCWLKRFIPKLFDTWKLNANPVFLYYGTVKNEKEARFLRLLARIPVDVLILTPDAEAPPMVSDPLLYEKKGSESVRMEKFPQNVNEISFGTVAYQAEQDLNTILYQDTGVYRNRQFKRAITVPISTTFEEIKILWKQEAKYRPDFAALEDRVMLPTIFSKISGVKGNNRNAYWQWVKGLITEDTLLIKSLPYITQQTPNPVKAHVTSFLKNRKLLPEKIRQHPSYQYGFIREDMQDYMFDKLEQLLDSGIIKGTYSQGAEYTICATALNINKDLLRVIQKFDFTKTVPKVIVINTTESLCSLEDSILTAYLSMLGFDVLIIVPTGYQSVERFYTRPLFTEHQIGDYIYDMAVPELEPAEGTSYKDIIIDRIFKRGR